jgi:penicillin amidase
MTILLVLLAQAETLEYQGEKIEATRDDRGIPSIRAASCIGVYYGEGWCEGHDRLRQMDKWRRSARGRLAEVVGRDSLNADKTARLHGYTDAEYSAMVAAASERTRAILRAYSDGVNAAIAARRDKKTLPEGWADEPWTPEDSLSISVMMSRRFGAGGDLEARSGQLLDLLEKMHGREIGRKIFDDLTRPDDPAATTTLGDHRTEPAPEREGGFAPRPGPDGYAERIAEAAAHWESQGVPAYSGSNAWIVSGKRTKSGRPLLYGGPMMGQGFPSICNEILLSCREFTAAGMSFPGLPGVLIGFNRRIAWTTTSGAADNTDIFLLELNPENPEQYRYRGGWKDFETRVEEFGVKGGDPEKVAIRRSVHGPVVAHSPEKKSAHAWRAAYWMSEAATSDAFLEFSFARSIDEFKKAVERITTSHNLLYADVDGHIGYWYAGRFPIRAKDHDPRFPAAGDGTQDWLGFLPFDKWPQTVDPERGYVANWNNKPSRDFTPFYQGKMYWGKKIEDELAQNPALTFERSWELARLTAYHMFSADYVAPHLIQACEGDEGLARAAELLSKWDRQFRENDPASALWAVFEEKILRRAFRDALPAPVWLLGRQVHRYLMDPLLYQLEGAKSPYRLKHSYFADAGEVLRDALKQSIADLEKKEKDWSKWSASDERIKMEPAGTFRSRRARGTYMIGVELAADGPRGLSSWAPGPSEDPASAQSRSMFDLYSRWEAKPVPWPKD